MSAVTRILPVIAVVVVTAATALSGLVLPVQSPTPASTGPVALGRQTTVCPVQPAAGRTSRLGAVVAEGVETGRLVGTRLDSADRVVELDRAGSAQLVTVDDTVLVRTEGGFSAGSGGAVLTTTPTGGARGISLAGCQAPGTEHWFTGVAASAAQSTRLLLTNPDATEAEVDLHFFASDGPVGAPGSLGIVVSGTKTVEVSLTGLLPGSVKGPVAVQVGASRGRVTAYAQSTYRDNVQPAGDAWAAPMPTPTTTMVIPGVPGGDGERELVLANPNERRAQVSIEVLGADGTFVPADNATIDVNAQSTASARLDSALDGEAVALRLTSDQPVAAAMVSTSSRSEAAADVAVQSVGTPIRGLALLGYAFGPDLTGRLLLSNNGDQPATVQFGARTFEQADRGSESVTVAPGSTATVELPDDRSGFVTVRSDNPAVYAGIVLSQPSGPVAGLATAALASSAAGASDLQVSMDPRTGTGRDH